MVEPNNSMKVPINGGEVTPDVNAEFKSNSTFYDHESDIEAFDNNLPKTVTLLRGENGSKLYLIGTAHFSYESQDDVSTVIQKVKPNIVVVELCKSRAMILQMDEETMLREAKNLTREKMIQTIKENGVLQGLMYILLLNLSSRLTKDLGLAPGGEFRRAFQEVKKLPCCLLTFGDRPIQITFKRVLMVLSWWNRIRLATTLLFSKKSMSLEEVEKYKESDFLSTVMEEIVDDYPELGKVFVEERDIFLTYSLQLATQHEFETQHGQRIPTVAVGVVGIGHTPGIKERWGKVLPSDIPPIMDTSTPPGPSTRMRICRIILFGVAVTAVYRVAKQPVMSAIRSVLWPGSSYKV